MTDQAGHCSDIVAIARNTGAKSVADGVETQSDFLAVRELGFDLLQGEMFAKPMTPRNFERTMPVRNYAAICLVGLYFAHGNRTVGKSAA